MRFNYLIGSLQEISKAVPRTLFTALVIMVLAIALGALLAVFRVKKIKVLNFLSKVLVTYVRGTPPVVQLLIVYYSLPSIIVYVAKLVFGKSMTTYDVPGMVSLIVAFVICMAGYQCEVIRGALNSVDYGQMEAGQAVGMTEKQAMWRIILPQVLNVAIPGFHILYVNRKGDVPGIYAPNRGYHGSSKAVFCRYCAVHRKLCGRGNCLLVYWCSFNFCV